MEEKIKVTRQHGVRLANYQRYRKVERKGKLPKKYNRLSITEALQTAKQRLTALVSCQRDKEIH